MSDKQRDIGSRQHAPEPFRAFTERFGDLGRLWEEVARAVDRTGPLDTRTRELVKLGIALGNFHETAARSHIRRAVAAGASREEVEQAVLLSATTCGLPRAVAGWQWVREALDERGR